MIVCYATACLLSSVLAALAHTLGSESENWMTGCHRLGRTASYLSLGSPNRVAHDVHFMISAVLAVAGMISRLYFVIRALSHDDCVRP
jgi:hypothetical protein